MQAENRAPIRIFYCIVEALDQGGDEPHDLGNVICANDAQFEEFAKIIRN